MRRNIANIVETVADGAGSRSLVATLLGLEASETMLADKVEAADEPNIVGMPLTLISAASKFCIRR